MIGRHIKTWIVLLPIVITGLVGCAEVQQLSRTNLNTLNKYNLLKFNPSNALKAKGIFQEVSTGESTNYQVYRPNTREGEKVENTLQYYLDNPDVVHKISHDERVKLYGAMQSVANALEEEYAVSQGGRVIKPQTIESIPLKSYCLDPNRSSPKTGEKMYLISATSLIPTELQGLYNDVLKYSSTNKKEGYNTQGLVWTIRRIIENPHQEIKLNDVYRRQLNLASPNGSSILESYGNRVLNKKGVTGSLLNEGLRLFKSKYSSEISKVKDRLNLSNYIPESVTGVQNALHRLDSLPVKGRIPNNLSEYSLLNDSVASRIVSPGGARAVTIELANYSDEPFTFLPIEYAAESQRKVQRLGFEPLLGVSIGLDLLPIAGTLKSLLELITGKDPVTGRDSSRWWAAVGLIPFGKWFKHGDEAIDIAKASGKYTKGVPINATKGVDDILKGAKAGRRTKGKTNQVIKDGGFGQANKDFDALSPTKVKDINTKFGSGRTGELSDGTRVTVRPGSSDGRPTLEIRNPSNGRGTEVRFDD